MGILIPLGAVLVGFISNKIYWMTLISIFYDTEHTKYTNSSLNSISPVRSNDTSQQVLSKSRFTKHKRFEEQKYADESIQNDDRSDFSAINKYETLNKLSSKLKKRKKIEFKWSDLLSMLICK